MMLARAAENLYWMARYLERTENTARLINSTTNLLLDLPRGASFGWANLIEIAGLDSLFNQNYPIANEEAIMRFLIDDKRNPSSIISCIQYARENTRTLRELLPAEMWERINSLYLYVREHSAQACRSRRDRYMVLNNIIEQRHAIVGLFAGTMAHDFSYYLIKLGRNVERADMTTRILDLISAVELPQDSEMHETLMEPMWINTLNSLSAYQTYRRLVSMHVRSGAVLKFLLGDMRFPRSVEHCLSEMESCFSLMPRSQRLQQSTVQLRRKIAQHHIEELSSVALHEYLDVLQADLGAIHNALTEQYFFPWNEKISMKDNNESECAQQ
jgi:uncharacterized alpha-E superfamily protein